MLNQQLKKKETDKKQYVELIKNFNNYEKDNMMIYADKNENSLIFFNPSYSALSEKVLKLKQDMINPFVALSDWLEEEILDVEAMQIAIKQIFHLLDTEDKLKAKLSTLEEDLQKGQQGQVNFFKTIFKKKEEVIAATEKEKEVTQQKIADIQEIIKIVGDNMENQIEVFKNDKTKNYYKYLKIFAIMQRESNRVVRELWELVRGALNDIAPNSVQNEKSEAPHNDEENQEYKEQNEIHDNDPNENENLEQNENIDNNENENHEHEQYEEQPPQEEGEGNTDQ